jgi:hypothetical protein
MTTDTSACRCSSLARQVSGPVPPSQDRVSVVGSHQPSADAASRCGATRQDFQTSKAQPAYFGEVGHVAQALGVVVASLLDDWGTGAIDSATRADLLEIIDDRTGQRATVITHQLPIGRWHAWLGDPTVADAILDPTHAAFPALQLGG